MAFSQTDSFSIYQSGVKAAQTAGETQYTTRNRQRLMLA